MDLMLNHVVCDLNRERHLAEARRIRTIRSIAGAAKGPSRWAPWTHRRRRSALPPDAADLHGAVEDAWRSPAGDGGR